MQDQIKQIQQAQAPTGSQSETESSARSQLVFEIYKVCEDGKESVFRAGERDRVLAEYEKLSLRANEVYELHYVILSNKVKRSRRQAYYASLSI